MSDETEYKEGCVLCGRHFIGDSSHWFTPPMSDSEIRFHERIYAPIKTALSKAKIVECDPTEDHLNDLIEALHLALKRVDEFRSLNHV